MTISVPITQQQGTTEKEEIWSTILSNVASSRMVPTKRMLVLGTTETFVTFASKLILTTNR